MAAWTPLVASCTAGGSWPFSPTSEIRVSFVELVSMRVTMSSRTARPGSVSPASRVACSPSRSNWPVRPAEHHGPHSSARPDRPCPRLRQPARRRSSHRKPRLVAAVTWSWHLLTTHREILQAVQAETDTVLGGDLAAAAPGGAHLLLEDPARQVRAYLR